MQILISQEKNVNHLNRQDYSPPSLLLLFQILENVASAYMGKPARSPWVFQNTLSVERHEAGGRLFLLLRREWKGEKIISCTPMCQAWDKMIIDQSTYLCNGHKYLAKGFII